jgi:hypothetical protein
MRYVLNGILNFTGRLLSYLNVIALLVFCERDSKHIVAIKNSYKHLQYVIAHLSRIKYVDLLINQLIANRGSW